MRTSITLALFLINLITSTSSSEYQHPFPQSKSPTLSPQFHTHLTLKCKVHYLNKCDRHCNVCESEGLNVTAPDTKMTEVTGFSVRNVAFYNNVVRLSINNQNCYFIPLETGKFFPNLETLRIWSSGLKKLDQNNIKGFEHMRELILPLNDIESLDSNLFEFNKKIMKIDLSRNKLKNVGLALFSSLQTLTHVNFNHNECIDDNFKSKLDKFMEKVRKFCPPTIEMLKNDVIFLIDQNENLKLSIDAKDALIRENCDYSKFEEVENKFEERYEQENYYQSHNNENHYKVHRYEEIDLR